MSTFPRGERGRAIGMLLVANVLWGLSFPLLKAIMLLQARLEPASTGPFITACTVAPRFLLAMVLLLLWRRRPGRAASARGCTALEMKQGLIIGFFGAGGMLLQNDGLRFTAASTSAFLTQFYAIMIPVWLAWRSRRNPGLAIWVSCVLVLAGVALLGRFDWRHLRLGRGEVETLLASGFFMVQILFLNSPGFRTARPGNLTLVMFILEGALFGSLALSLAPTGGPWLPLATSLPWLTLTLILTVFCTVGAFTLMNTWQPKVTATEAGLLYCFEPIFGSLFALVLPGLFSRWTGIAYPNESASLNLLVGGGLITAANAVLQVRPPPAPAQRTPPGGTR